MLIEVHIIQNHAPSNLNRDDSGSPKSAIFGGYRRARISSQCLKRCYRTSKTFRDEVDGLGMHTRSMPEEIKRRLLDHAKALKTENHKEKFEEWAEKCQAKLAAILGKGEKESGTEEPEETEESPSSSDEEDGTDDGGGAGKKEKYQTAQSVFWREAELNALFHAYRERIEWDSFVPDDMRLAFDKNKKLDAKKMLDWAKNFQSLGETEKANLPEAQRNLLKNIESIKILINSNSNMAESKQKKHGKNAKPGSA